MSTEENSTSKPSASARINSSGQKDAPQFVPPVPTHWPSTHFVLAAGTATFQPSTAKVVIVEDTTRRPKNEPRERWSWFLPRGRKDQGESLEQCAIRETLEEAGYVANLLSTPVPTRQPRNAESEAIQSEAFHIQLLPFPVNHRCPILAHISDVGMYLSFWYLCTIPYGAVRDTDYGARFVGNHETGYNSELVDITEAVKLLSGGRLEYRHPRKFGDGALGRVVERRTGNEVHWGDLEANDPGSTEALIVGLGWGWANARGEGEDVEEIVGEADRLKI